MALFAKNSSVCVSEATAVKSPDPCLLPSQQGGEEVICTSPYVGQWTCGSEYLPAPAAISVILTHLDFARTSHSTE